MAVIKIPKGDQHPEAITPRTDMLGQVRDVVGLIWIELYLL